MTSLLLKVTLLSSIEGVKIDKLLDHINEYFSTNHVKWKVRLHQFKTNRRQVDFAMTQNSDYLTSKIILVIDM